MTRQLGLCGALLLALLSCTAQANEVAMVTALSGTVEWQAPGAAPAMPLKAFSKLRAGDRLKLAAAARVQLVFFQSGREEVWQGAGDLLLGSEASAVTTGTPQQQSRLLPRLLVKQLARTPAPEGQIRAGMVRLRSMPSGGTLESVENNYAELRSKAAATDRNPELYLLAGYFELREFAKLQQLLARLDEQSPGSNELAVLRSLYVRAMNNAKMAEEQ
ncbi:hypothetical protein [Pseudomonas sp.]|uniref:hypothetical protein n=1 Tax=Pseudomonas sp. TaxID=306 RepID=UPI0027370D9A|nr:hypothetical protein [Pseudomonas sp.]MDP3817180.1 hypothetical protein [Pseudomonas sp.]